MAAGLSFAVAFADLVATPNLLSGTGNSEPRSDARYQQAQAEIITADGEQQKAGAYDPGCPYPKGRDDADLCEQRRMAKAAEETAALAYSQYWWNVAQAVGTMLAAFAAAWAAREASRAVRLASNNAQAELRAYLSVTPLGIDFAGEYGIAAVHVEVRNSGHTPAREISMHFRANILPYPLPHGFDLDLHDQGATGLTIGAQIATPHPFPLKARATPEEIQELRSGKFAFYVMLGVYYTDVFNRRHATILCASAEGAAFVGAMENTGFKPGDRMQALWGIHAGYCRAD